jgi:hypothetical protein
MVRRQHGTEAGQQSDVEKYKKQEEYKTMKNSKETKWGGKMEYLFKNNIWNLPTRFLEYEKYLRALNKKGEIAWFNDIQYLTFKRGLPQPDKNKKTKKQEIITLKDMRAGAYIKRYVDAPIKQATDQKYAGRIKFWEENLNYIENKNVKLTDLNKKKKQHPLYWIIQNHEELMYNIIKYHNTENHSLSTLNSDFKALVRITKLILGDKAELRYKFSALQVGLTDLENNMDDSNQLESEQEKRQFVAQEKLWDKLEEMEDKWWKEYADQKYGPEKNKIFDFHQTLLSLALFVWDYPSRQEKYTLEFLEEKDEAKAYKPEGKNKNYVVIPNPQTARSSGKARDGPRCKFIFNEIKKTHLPISYELRTSNSKLDQYNYRLHKWLVWSFDWYPRKYVFIAKKSWSKYKKTNPQIKAETVSNWVRSIYPNKNLGVDGFRSSFVSYWLPQMNNMEKKVMATRMRTSLDILYRAYLKIFIYSSPNKRVEIKPDPDWLTQQKALEGNTKKTAIEVADNDVVISGITGLELFQPPAPPPPAPPAPPPARNELPQDAPAVSIRAQKNKQNFKKWYKKPENQKDHKNRVREHSKEERTYAQRMVRELNKKIIHIDNIRQKTLDKYGIQWTGMDFITTKY